MFNSLRDLLFFTDSAAAIPPPWPVTTQQDIFLLEACAILSPPMDLPTTNKFEIFFWHKRSIWNLHISTSCW